MSNSQNPIVRLLRGLWNGVDGARRFTMNLLFLAIVIGILVLVFRDNLPEIEDGSALVIAPRGVLVERMTRDSSAFCSRLRESQTR